MRRPSAALITAAALAAVVMVVALTIGMRRADDAAPRPQSSTATAPDTGSRRAACAFAPGERAAFVLQITGLAAAAPGQEDLFAAVLSWEAVASPRPDESLLRAAFSATQLRQALSRSDQRVAQPLDGTFMIRVGRDCRFTGAGYPPDWQPLTRRFVATVLHTFEFVLDSRRSELSWEVEQRDALGSYTARYAAVPLAGGELAMTKVKTRYRDGDEGLVNLQVQLVGATATATLDARGRWLRRASGREQVLIRVQGALLADLEQRYELMRDDARFVRPDGAVQLAELEWQDPFAMAVAAADAPVDPAVAKLSFDDALNRFSEAYAKTPGGDAYAAALLLSQWLRAHPEGAAALIATIRDGGIPELLRPAAFLALERCGTPQARAALMTALADESMTEMDRARAASALSDIPQPTQESARALVEAASDSQPKLVAGTSVRALGHLTERARTLDPEMRRELQAALDRELAAARDTSRAIDVVDAIGNSGDAAFVPALEARMADGSPAMREHAARALRRMAPSDAAAPLLERLAIENDPGVQTALVDTLAALEVREPSAIAMADSQLAKQPAPEVRAALIRWLGAAANEQTARQALVAQFRRESDPQLQQLIGRFVSADDLS